MEEVTFLPLNGAENQTECFWVSVKTDRLVEESEIFSLTLFSSDEAIVLTASTAEVTITDNDGKCQVMCGYSMFYWHNCLFVIMQLSVKSHPWTLPEDILVGQRRTLRRQQWLNVRMEPPHVSALWMASGMNLTPNNAMSVQMSSSDISKRCAVYGGSCEKKRVNLLLDIAYYNINVKVCTLNVYILLGAAWIQQEQLEGAIVCYPSTSQSEY